MRGRNVKIVSVISHFFPFIGGAQTHLRQVSERLARRGHRVTVLTQAAPGAPEHQRLGKLNIHRFECPNETAFAEIYRHVRSHEFTDSVFYVFLNVGADSERTLWTLKILEHVRHRSIPRIIRITSSGRVEQLARQYPAGITELRGANYIIALNPGIESELLDAGVDREKIVTMPNGVDPTRFRPDPSRRGMPTERIFLSPSRIDPKKKLGELITLWGQHLNCLAHTNSRLRVLASSQDAKDLQTWNALQSAARQNGYRNIEFISGMPHSGMHDQYQRADIYITLSTEEGMSNAMLEAMASGLTIVAPATRATTALIRDKWNGFLFIPDDMRSAATTVNRALNAPAELLNLIASRNRGLVESRYSIDLISERFSRLFNSCMSPTLKTPASTATSAFQPAARLLALS